MPISSKEIIFRQIQFCVSRALPHVTAPPESKLGFALSTKGLDPVNGLRHPPENGTNGWYLWCGENYSEDAEFFQPLHTQHLYDEYPDLIKLLGLPPGYRFLVAGDYLDVWFDASLLDI